MQLEQGRRHADRAQGASTPEKSTYAMYMQGWFQWCINLFARFEPCALVLSEMGRLLGRTLDSLVG